MWHLPPPHHGMHIYKLMMSSAATSAWHLPNQTGTATPSVKYACSSMRMCGVCCVWVEGWGGYVGVVGANDFRLGSERISVVRPAHMCDIHLILLRTTIIINTQRLIPCLAVAVRRLNHQSANVKPHILYLSLFTVRVLSVLYAILPRQKPSYHGVIRLTELAFITLVIVTCREREREPYQAPFALGRSFVRNRHKVHERTH